MKTLAQFMGILLLVLFFAGCAEDDDPVQTDGSAPTTSTAALAVTNITSTGLTLSWTAASDDQTGAADLRYWVFQTTDGDLLTTIDLAFANGTKLVDDVKAVTTVAVTGLTTDTTYFFNVVVADGAGNRTLYDGTYGTPVSTADTTVPTVGGGGAVTLADKGSAVTISWSAATDSVTSASSLYYIVYYSTSNNITTAADAVANGTAATDWTADMTSLTLSGLSGATTYYVSVLVKDTAANIAIYTTSSVTTGTYVYLYQYSGALMQDGGIGGRSGADAFCEAESLSVSCNSRRGFLSVSSTDEIADMPTNYYLPTDREVRSVSGTTLATSWSDLLDGTISATLSAGGVADGIWMSGSNSDGTVYTGFNCNGFTDSTSSYGLARGSYLNTNSGWITSGTVASCANVWTRVVCACW